MPCWSGRNQRPQLHPHAGYERGWTLWNRQKGMVRCCCVNLCVVSFEREPGCRKSRRLKASTNGVKEPLFLVSRKAPPASLSPKIFPFLPASKPRQQHNTSSQHSTQPIMDTFTPAPMPSALTFELVARCSVSCLLIPPFQAHKTHSDNSSPDHQGPRCQPHPPSWSRPTPLIHASRNPSIPQRTDSRTTRGHRLPTMSQQHISFRVEAWTRRPGEDWRGA